LTLTPSNMPDLGLPAPDFALPDVHGQTMRLADFADSPALLVAFWCNHCPYVKHVRRAFVEFARDYQARGLAILAINANDARTYPEDAPACMQAVAEEYGYPFPYLHDASQAVAKAYRAACTPDFFLYDADRRLVYRGQFDASRPGNDVPVTGADLRAAADAVLAGAPVPAEQRPSIGCNIKWKPAHAPR
jgi:peroxiredoxin